MFATGIIPTLITRTQSTKVKSIETCARHWLLEHTQSTNVNWDMCPTVITRTQSTKVIWNMCPTLITRTQSTTVIWDMCPTLITRAYTEYKCQLRHVSDGDNSNTGYKCHLRHVSDTDNSNRAQKSSETCVVFVFFINPS